MSEKLFIYNADVWCPSCAQKIKEKIAGEYADKLAEQLIDKFGLGGTDMDAFRQRVVELIIDQMDEAEETAYDSDDWPKPGVSEPTDSPQHCGSGEDCEEAEVLDEGAKIGKLLGTELTDEGVRYLNEMLSEPKYPNTAGHQAQVHRFWRNEFSHYPLTQ